MIDITKFKEGDSVMLYTKLDLFDYKTWLAPFTRFFTNLYRSKNNKCPYTHCGNIVLFEDNLYFYEAGPKGYIKTKINERFKSTIYSDILIKRPIFEFSKIKYTRAAESLLNKKYDFGDVMVSELIDQLTKGRVWIGNNNPQKRVFCSESAGYLYFKATNGAEFIDWFKMAPTDLYDSKLFNTIR